jgi:hypothetical protein
LKDALPRYQERVKEEGKWKTGCTKLSKAPQESASMTQSFRTFKVGCSEPCGLEIVVQGKKMEKN